jgi:cytoskeletal protein CcmA (bactofilin family)
MTAWISGGMESRMFGSEKRGAEDELNSFIGEGTRFQGTIDVRGSIQIDGHVEGEVQSTSSVRIGETGVVIADVRSREATVAGRLRGTLMATERVELLSGSRLEGDVHAQSFKIEDGAFFHGNCVMGEVADGATARPAYGSDTR